MARTRRRISRREMKEDRFILWLFELSGEIDKHKKTLIAAAVLVIVSVAGGYYWVNKQSDDLVEAGKLFAPGQTAMQDSRYEDAIPMFERVVNEYGRTSVALEATIELANASFLAGDYERRANTIVPTWTNTTGRTRISGRQHDRDWPRVTKRKRSSKRRPTSISPWRTKIRRATSLPVYSSTRLGVSGPPGRRTRHGSCTTAWSKTTNPRPMPGMPRSR